MKVFQWFFVAAFLLVAGDFPAIALESKTFSRDAIVDYHVDHDGKIGLRAEEIYSFLERVPAGALKFHDLQQSASGRIPDRVTVQLVRGSERTALRSRIMNSLVEIEHPALQRGDVLNVAADYMPRGSAPGHPLMVARAFSPHERWTEARISFAGPGVRKLGLVIVGFQKIAVSARGEEKQVWVYRAGAPDLPEALSVHAIEYAARFHVSEAPDWSALGRDYHQAFQVSPALKASVKQMAHQIVPESAAPHEKASAIAAFLARDFWIEDDRRGVVIVPSRSLEQIMTQRRGSRIDIARLGYALLTAHGLEVEPVLSNHRMIYKQPPVPVAGFDTAFLVLKPSGEVLNPGVDTKLHASIPPAFAGKFALRLAKAGAEPLTLDMPDINADRVRIVAELSLSPKGQLSGLTRTEATGASGLLLASHVETLLKLEQPHLVRRLLSLQNLDGTVELLPIRQEIGVGKVIVEHSYALQSQLHRQNMLRLPLFAGPRLIRPPQNPYLAAIQQGATQPIACRPQQFEQEIIIHLPYARAIPDLKHDQRIILPFASYSSEYRLETAQRLHIRRQLVISPPGPTCAKAFIDEIAPVIRAAARDMERAVSISAEGF